MSADDKRRELEDVIAAQLKAIREEAIVATSNYIGAHLSVEHLVRHLSYGSQHEAARTIRAAADTHAQAKVDEAVGAMRLQLATYEHSRRTS